MSIKCTVAIQREDSLYVANCLENNVASQGATLDEAIENLKEAIALYYEDEPQIPAHSQIFVTTMEVAV